MRITARILAGAGSAVLALACAAAVAAPANASPNSLTLKVDNVQLGHGGDTTGATYIYACDDRADGLGVRMHYLLRNGAGGTVGDANGSAAGCGGRTVTSASNPAVEMELCAGVNSADTYCTGWWPA
ncbi:hypothetical protein [Kutzneria sp. NPDC052558]|uniref:hypothetical protein n=1 Tax=Kutzneria sp. NPDC052558 TaxID=3364121 RepID=UPI0037CA74DB